MEWWKANGDKILRTIIHGGLMAGAIYIGTHPEFAMYAPVLQYFGSAIDSPRG